MAGACCFGYGLPGQLVCMIGIALEPENASQRYARAVDMIEVELIRSCTLEALDIQHCCLKVRASQGAIARDMVGDTQCQLYARKAFGVAAPRCNGLALLGQSESFGEIPSSEMVEMQLLDQTKLVGWIINLVSKPESSRQVRARRFGG